MFDRHVAEPVDVITDGQRHHIIAQDQQPEGQIDRCQPVDDPSRGEKPDDPHQRHHQAVQKTHDRHAAVFLNHHGKQKAQNRRPHQNAERQINQYSESGDVLTHKQPARMLVLMGESLVTELPSAKQNSSCRCGWPKLPAPTLCVSRQVARSARLERRRPRQPQDRGQRAAFWPVKRSQLLPESRSHCLPA